jgi:hypothetical protein
VRKLSDGREFKGTWDFDDREDALILKGLKGRIQHLTIQMLNATVLVLVPKKVGTRRSLIPVWYFNKN